MHSTSDDSAQNQTKLLSIAETDPHTAQIGFSRREQRWTRLSKSEDEKSVRFLWNFDEAFDSLFQHMHGFSKGSCLGPNMGFNWDQQLQ